jgi:hypothetical protein
MIVLGAEKLKVTAPARAKEPVTPVPASKAEKAEDKTTTTTNKKKKR